MCYLIDGVNSLIENQKFQDGINALVSTLVELTYRLLWIFFMIKYMIRGLIIAGSMYLADTKYTKPVNHQ